jgi:Uma2 family endonuclease
MLEISISSELAAAHPVLMAGCAKRGHEVEVFENAGTGAEAREVSLAVQGESEALRDDATKSDRVGGSLERMPTLVRDPQPAEFEALLERRRRLAQDVLDEVWDGVLHMNPAPHGRHANIQQQLAVLLDPVARQAGLLPRVGIFNLGEPENYRVPDGALMRLGPDELYYATAALVIEIVSPDDETYAKLPFYAAHKVDELLIVDPQERTVRWLELTGERYEPSQRSGLIDLGPDELAQRIDWP